MNSSTHSILLGVVAILCWSSLATLGALTLHLPPFYILGFSFVVGALPSLRKPLHIFTNWRVTLWGIFGYYSYHFFLFYSFRFAPALEANLINYLWPMLLVILTPLFFSQNKLKLYHIVGASLSAIGCVVLVWSKGIELKWENFTGYLLALAAALTWPIYTLVKKKMGEIPVWSVGGFCMGAGLLCFLTHSLIEPRVVLQPRDAGLLFAMGIGPFGLSFYAWDLALQKGDSRVMGALSYLTPVLSTLALVLFADQNMETSTFVAMLLIIGGASTGLLDFLPSRDLVK